MAAAIAWLLNLDADFELGNLGSWSPSRDLIERVELVSKHAEHLLSPGDVLLKEGVKVPAGTIGRAWCPTPSALARLREAGATPEQAPSFEILKKVNDRSFNASLGQTLPGAAYVVDLASAQKIVGRRRIPWLLKRAFGAAGRGQRLVEASGLTDADIAWIEASLRRGGLQVEPWVEIEREFVVHGFIHQSGAAEIHEPLVQECEEGGAWSSTRQALPGELSANESAQLDQQAFLVAGDLVQAGYFGPFGVDAYRWVKSSGERVLNSRGEINARYTMGWGLFLGRVSS
jgi:hypothetical protein